MKHYRTSEIARAAKVHPNTVRLYEQWGFLPPVPRNKSGYRLFSERHLDQMLLARIALRCEYAEGNIRRLAIVVIKTAASGDMLNAIEQAENHLLQIMHERAKAEEALVLARGWVNGDPGEQSGIYIKRLDVAKLLGVSIDVLRNWERNGLVRILRNPDNGYRIYGPCEINRLKVIRTLRAANYSIMAIYRMMRHVDHGGGKDATELLDKPLPQEDIVRATDKWISALTESEQDARELIAHIQEMAAKNYCESECYQDGISPNLGGPAAIN